MNTLESRSSITTQESIMKWFKHDSNAIMDEGLQCVILKFGMEGYGMYWLCLELISSKVTEDDQSFELKHPPQVISRMCGLNTQKVSEILTYFADLKLLEEIDGRFSCMKMLKRIDKSMTSSAKLRNSLAETRKDLGKGQISHARREEKENRNKPIVLFEDFWKSYPRKEKKALSEKCFLSKIKSEEVPMVMEKLEAFKRSEAWTKDDGKFIPHATTWINQRRFEDDIETTVPDQPKYRSLREIADEEDKLFSQPDSDIPE